MPKEPYDYQLEYGSAPAAPQAPNPFETPGDAGQQAQPAAPQTPVAPAAPQRPQRVDPLSPYIPPEGGQARPRQGTAAPSPRDTASFPRRVVAEMDGRQISLETPRQGQSAGAAYSRPGTRRQGAAASSQRDELGRAMNELADVFSRDVAPALQQAGREVSAAMRQAGKQVGPVMHQAGRNIRRAAQEARAAQTAQSARQQAVQFSRAEKRRMDFRRAASLCGGTICTVLFAIFLAGFFAMLGDGASLGEVFTLLPFLAASEFGMIRLWRNAGRWKRAKHYREFLDGWAGCTLKELSAGTGRSEEYLRKDLQKMIGGRYLRGAFLDVRDNVLFADEASYREYLDERRAREMEEKARRQQEAARAEEQRRLEEEESQPVIEESFPTEAGRFLAQLAVLRGEIEDPLVLEQVDQLEKIVGGISGWVADHPASAPKVKRLSSYYLPTTLKLLRTYTTVDSNPGPTAQNICQNITGILHTFNTALLTMQDSLLEDTALDVSAEISVLESMLQQEGLTGTADFAPVAVRGELPPGEEEPLSPELRLP